MHRLYRAINRLSHHRRIFQGIFLLLCLGYTSVVFWHIFTHDITTHGHDFAFLLLPLFLGAMTLPVVAFTFLAAVLVIASIGVSWIRMNDPWVFPGDPFFLIFCFFSTTLLAATVLHRRYTFHQRQRSENSEQMLAKRLKVVEALHQSAIAVNSELDLAGVLEQILYQLEGVVAYDSAAIFLVKDDRLVIQAARGFPERAHLIGASFPKDDNLFTQARAMGRALILDDASLDEQFKRWAGTSYTRGWMGVALIAHGKVIGYLTIDSRQPKAYGAAEADLVQTIGLHAAVAIENALLYENAVKLAERAMILHDASTAIGAALDPEELYREIHRAASRLMSCEAFAITILDENNHEVMAVYLMDRDGRSPNIRTPIDQGFTGYIIRTGKSIIIDEFSENLDIPSIHYGGPDEVKSILAVPMRRQDSKVFGMLSAQSYSANVYNADDQTMLELLGAQAAIAIENARLLVQAQKMASTDSLTGLHNRRHFLELAQQEFERALRYTTPFSICMIDLDLFKIINDTYGHLTGDKVLQEIAACCQEIMRKVDVLARFGGDELVVLMPETTLEDGWRAADRLRDRIASFEIILDNQTIGLTASLGVAVVDDTCPDLKTLIIRADMALYAAKQNGGNKVATWVQ